MLEFKNISKSYGAGPPVLESIDLRIEEGEIVAIVGASGCGKSTLLRIAAGLDRPSSGTVVLDGEPSVGPHPSVGVVFQEPRLLPWLTVAKNIAFGIAGLPAAEREESVAEALDLIGIADHASKWPRELSGGQSQRVAIARALVARPSVILLDEPFSALDAITRADLQRHVLDLRRRMNLTLVVVTHDLDEALLLGDRIVIMQRDPGRIARAISNPRNDGADAAELRRDLVATFERVNVSRNGAAA